jgi:hypothetical protein
LCQVVVGGPVATLGAAVVAGLLEWPRPDGPADSASLAVVAYWLLGSRRWFPPPPDNTIAASPGIWSLARTDEIP